MMSRHLRSTACAAALAISAIVAGAASAASTATPATGAATQQMAPKATPKASPRLESVADRYEDAKALGRQALADITAAWAAIEAKDGNAARHALTGAINRLDRAAGHSTYQVVATEHGTVTDWWIPTGPRPKSDFDANLGPITPEKFTATPLHGNTGHAIYDSLLARDSTQIMIPVRDARSNLREALVYVRQGSFDKAHAAMRGLFDSSVLVATEADLFPGKPEA